MKCSTLVAGHNLEELGDLVRWAADKGMAGVSFQALRPLGDDWAKLWPEAARTRKALMELRSLKSNGWPVLNSDGQLLAMIRYFEDPQLGFPEEICGTYAHWNVKADGSVRTCSYKEAIGNIRTAPPEVIWASVTSRARFDEVLGCKKACLLLNCHFRSPIIALKVSPN